MGGTHKFTSSIWIQSGSGPARFQSGITASTVTATTFIGDGSGLTGLDTAVFFAGSGSGISASKPTSTDHIQILDASAATSSIYRIETTSSVGFKPNHYVFIKLTDKFETLQQGSTSSYYANDRTSGGDSTGEQPFTNDLAPGVHRYIVYATDTGSSGETHAVYTSAFIQGYVNAPPSIVAPFQSNGIVQIPHDSNTLTHILRFTGSSEPNTVSNDFIRVFSASRSTFDPNTPSSTTAAYDLTMQHHQADITDSDNFIATGSVDSGNPYLAARGVYGAGTANTAALPKSALLFTASISGYDTTNGKIIHVDSIQAREERFTITMFDNWYVNHSSSLEYSMSIVPPNTASIVNTRIRYESGSFTGVTTNTFTTPILYDDTETRASIDGLDDRYTASLVRVSVMADITEPADYESDGTHFTDIRLLSSNGLDPLHQKTFRFSGSMSGPGLFRATASAYGTEFAFNNVTESLGFSPFVYPVGTFNANVYTTYDTDYLRHGDHHHISQLDRAGGTTLTVESVPNIQISNIRVEVESGSFLTNKGAFERTASVLYGYTSSLRIAETSSLEGYEKSAEYISESVVRMRLLATITEPFGPHHTNMQSTLSTTGHSHTFAFHTGSEETASSAIAYDSSNRLVGNYTSSWVDFNLSPGVYDFNTSFISNTNTGRTIFPGIFASVSVSNTPATEITNIRYETETAGYSEAGSTNAMRTVLYGIPRHTLVDSSSFAGHANAVTYASHSVSRFRVLADIREPFGPHHTASKFEKVWTAGSESPITDVIHFSTGSTDTASSAIDYDSANRLFARYTSSWIGQQLSSNNNASKTWTYTSGSISHTPNDLSGFITTSGLSTQLKVNDTAKTHISNRIYEFEEYGHSASSAADTGVTNTIRTVLYGNSYHTLIDSSSLNELPELRRMAYASQSVSRARLRVRVTEPIGPGIGSVQIKRNWHGTISDGINAHTNSADFESISHDYDSQKRLVAHYTQSWIGQQLDGYTAFAQFGFNEFTTRIASWEQDISSSLESTGENGLTGTLSSDETTADLIVRNTAPTQITNVRYQTETFGYSREPSIDTTRKVLYGVPHKTNTGTGSGDTGESWASHDSASLYASQSITRFRVLATITEPVGPLHTASKFEKVWTSNNEPIIRDVIHFSTASGDITASSAIAYDSSNRLVAHYTSSWVGVELASNNFDTGEQWTYTSGSILHEPAGENGFITSSGKSTTITVFDTQPTIFSNFKTETETFGYSNIPTRNAFRKVLYGVAHKTLEDSSSFIGHDSASLYASQSVSQFRIVATITEPVGPLQHTASRIEKIFKNEIETVDSKTETIIFGTASIGFEASRSFFTPVGEFVTEYTTSFIGKELEVQGGAAAERDWSISTGSVIHNPPGENAANSSSFIPTTVKVQNTEKVKIEKIFWETETYGYSDEEISNTIRTVLYGNNRVTDIDSSSYENHVNSGSYASQSVSRVRFRAQVTEPIGPAVNKLQAEFSYGSTTTNFEIHTGSIENGGTLSSRYIDNKLVAFYTSSFIGRQFDTTTGDQKTHILNGTFTELTSGENDLDQLSDVTNGSIIVHDTAPTEITNVRYETETFGYSEDISTNTTRKVLYGDTQVTNTGTGSGESGESWTSHDSASLYASHSVTRFRVLATITEPVGPLHTASRFDQTWTAPNLDNGSPYRLFSDSLYFSTASGDITASSAIAYDSSNRLVAQYVSEWKGKGLSSSIYVNDEHQNGEIYTYTGTVSHAPDNEPAGESTTPVKSTITVYDTFPTQFTNISFETETFGYSGVPSTNTMRKVLYGVPHHTIADTGSLYWKNHDSASLYASQSVTRFRISATVTEPIGPLHTGSIIHQQFASAVDSTALIENVMSETNTVTSTRRFNGEIEGAFENSPSPGTGYYCNSNEQITIIFGQSQLLARVEINVDEGTVNPTIEASPDGGTTFRALNVYDNTISPERGYTYYRINLNNSGTILVSDIRLYTPTFTEPRLFNSTTLKLNTTGDVETSASGYDVQSQLVSHYTSSWFGVQLSSSKQLGIQFFGGPPTDGEQWQYTLSNIIHSPGDLSLVSQPENPAAANVEVYDTANPRYDDFDIQSETFGYSDVPASIIRRTILYGNTTTDIDSSSYADHVSASLYASHSVTRVRAVTRIVEPVGPLIHTASNIQIQYLNFADGGYLGDSDNIVFGTGSDTFVRSFFTPVGEFVAEYTSSYQGKAFPFTDQQWGSTATVTHQYPGENFQQPTSTGLSLHINDTEPTQIDSIAYETETHGHSGIASTDTARKVLYGDNGTTNINSESFKGHDHVAAYASHSVSQFRVRARIIEPVGPLHTASRFDRVWSADGVASITDTLHFSTASNNVISKSFSDSAGRFVVEYTTSFAGVALTAPNATTREWTYTSGSILHEPEGENGFVTASGDSSIVTVTGTPKTQIRNIRVETETVGHSNTGIQNTNVANHGAVSRSILYGETTSFTDSSSFKNEPGAKIFADKSVTRFRILADITEPIGPHHTGSLFAYTKDAVIAVENENDEVEFLSNQTVPSGEGTSDFILFSTASNQTASSNIIYNTDTKELEASYTSSWFSESLSPSRTTTDGYWHIYVDAVNVKHSPKDNSQVDIDTTANDLYMVVSASEQIEIKRPIVELETFYSSSVGVYTGADKQIRTLLYGFNRTLSASDANTIGDIWSGSAAIRPRILTSITEPLGFRHFPVKMAYTQVGETKIDTVSTFFDIYTPGSTSPTRSLSTSSLDVSSRSARTLNSEGRYVTHYTSSFTDQFTYRSGSYNLTPAIDARTVIPGVYTNQTKFNQIELLAGQEFTVGRAVPTEITNLRIEVETVSGSFIGTGSRTTTILHGNTVTEADKTDNTGYPTETARQQLTSVRLLADIAEPFGPFHTASVFTIGGFNSSIQNLDSVGELYDPGDVPASGDIISSTNLNVTPNNIFTYIIDGLDKEWVPLSDQTFPSHITTNINAITDGVISPTGNISSDLGTPFSNFSLKKSAHFNLIIDLGASNTTVVNSYLFNQAIWVLKEWKLYGSNSAIGMPIQDPGGAQFTPRPYVDNGEGWNSDWILLHSVTNHTPADGLHLQQLTFTNETVYRYYWLLSEGESTVVSNNNSTNGTFLVELALYNADAQPVSDTVTDETRLVPENNFDTLINQPNEGFMYIFYKFNTPTIVDKLRAYIASTDAAEIDGIGSEHKFIASNTQINAVDLQTAPAFGVDGVIKSIGLDNRSMISYKFDNDTAYEYYAWRLHTRNYSSAYQYYAFDMQNTAQSDLKIVRLETGSADVTLKTELMYDQHGSSSIAYTSSFIPVELQSGIHDITIESVVHEVDDHKNVSESRHADISVFQTATASVFVNPQTGSQFFSSSAFFARYVTYNEQHVGAGIPVQFISGISASAPPETSESILLFPQHLNVRYMTSHGKIRFQDNSTIFHGTSAGQDTASLTISDDYLESLANGQTQYVQISGSNILPGNGSSDEIILNYDIIPAKPQSMHDMYWGPAGTTGAHIIGSTGIDIPSVDGKPQQLYQGTLAGGLPFYNEAANHVAGTEVDNIIMAKDSATGPVNYNITFNTFTPSDTGNYQDNDRLFDRGDKGSLIVKINGYKVVEADLAANFDTDPAKVAGGQLMSGYNAGGFTNGEAAFKEFDPNTIQLVDKGKLVLTEVGPFNNVHRDIFNAGEHYPNGYQGWSAKIVLTDKLYDGYNKLEFEHVFDDGTKQSWTPFEWYYDDNTILATTDASATAEYSMPNAEPTFSRSGVSFFTVGENIDININNAFKGLAGETYALDSQTIMQTDITDQGLMYTPGGIVTTLPHRLESEADARGLSFPSIALTPFRNNTASLSLTLQGTTGNYTSEQGETKFINIKQFNRDYTDAHTFTMDSVGHPITIGRFAIKGALSSGAESEEDFNTEDYRWKHTTMGNNAIANNNDPGGLGNSSDNLQLNFMYWVDPTKTDYNSSTDLLELDELQVSYLGHLMYPSLQYTGLPNQLDRDYSGINDDRYFYRAFDLGTAAAYNDLKTTIEFNSLTAGSHAVTSADLFAQTAGNNGLPVNIDATDIRIDIKLPGAFDTNNVQTPIKTGTAWGAIGGGSGFASNIRTDGWTSAAAGIAGFTPTIILPGQSDGTHTAGSKEFIIRTRTGNFWSTGLTNGIVLMRIRIKAGYAGKITKIQMSPY